MGIHWSSTFTAAVATVMNSSTSARSMKKAANRPWGRGRHYYTHDPGNIPRIFTSETLVVSRNLFVEETVNPDQVWNALEPESNPYNVVGLGGGAGPGRGLPRRSRARPPEPTRRCERRSIPLAGP